MGREPAKLFIRMVMSEQERGNHPQSFSAETTTNVDGCENPDKTGGGCRVAAEASELAGLLAAGAVCRSINCRCISSII
jgi:hypothetical protein